MPQTASAARVICGVDVSLSGRCYRELRRLRRACRTEPVLCGRTYQAGETPNATASKRRCRSLRRRSRARWSRGLCGVRLFSPPKTYCGVKGVEVAAACIAANKASQAAPAAAPTPAAVKPRRTPSSAAPAAPAAPRAQSPAPRTSPTKAPEPAVGMARMTSPSSPASSGTSWWLIFLQLATLLLVFYLLFRRQGQGQREQKGWMQSPAWEPFDDEWQPQAGGKHAERVDAQAQDNDHDAVLANLEQIEEKLQDWRDHQSEQMQQMQELHSPRNEMQSEADALFAYYLQLAQHVVSEVEGSEGGMSEPRRRLIEARDRLHWIFRAHRELPNPSSPIDELKASSWHHIQRLLETMGYVGWDSKLQGHMANGQFSASEFLLRKSADQAGRFMAGEELQEYASMREEFVGCLERLYRSNLATLRAACEQQSEQLSSAEEMELFHRDYVVGFLLEELPLLLQDVTRRSSPDRSGALVDQFIQFIEDDLTEAKIELFPVLDAEMTETVGARLIYLLHAGVRAIGSDGQSVVLREPNESIMSVSAAQEESALPIDDAAATSASELAAPVSRESKSIRLVANEDGNNDQLTFEIPSHLDVDLSDDLSFDIELESGARTSWFDAPAEERLFAPGTADRESSEEITAMEETAAPSIGHPDSNPPEHTAEMSLASHSPERAGQSEPLPTGPLPHIENVTQGFVAAIPESELAQRKITREYGPEASPSISPEDS